MELSSEILPSGLDKEIAPPFPELEEVESVVTPEREILPLELVKEIAPPSLPLAIALDPASKILPLAVENEIAPALAEVPDSPSDRVSVVELMSEISPLKLEKETIPPFPALPEIDRE